MSKLPGGASPMHMHSTITFPGSEGTDGGTMKYVPPRSRDWAISLAVVMFAISSERVARAALPDGCDELGTALVSHSCFHATHGPYQSVMASVGRTASAATPNIDKVHTNFNVGLPSPAGEQSVTYRPVRSGAWSVFTDGKADLLVIGPDDAEVAMLPGRAQGCAFLPETRIYQLDAGHQYRFVFRRAVAKETVVVNEFLGDFLTRNGRDGDGDGFGTDRDVVVTSCAPPAGYVGNDTDCDDGNAAIHPGALEHCDDVDENCNGSPDEVGLLCVSGQGACLRRGTSTCPSPGAPVRCDAVAATPSDEICNGVDDDCDGAVDDGGDALCTSDPDRSACTPDGASASCGCNIDRDCGARDSERICLAATRSCADGCIAWPGYNGCRPGRFCTSRDPKTPGRCTDHCNADVDCADTSGRPFCSQDRGAGNGCVQCMTNTHCSSSETRGGSACLPGGRCGCASDRDCAERSVCDTSLGACVARSSGDTIDAGAGDDSGDSSYADIPRESGCGCRMGAQGSGAYRALAAMMVGALLFRRRAARGRRS